MLQGVYVLRTPKPRILWVKTLKREVTTVPALRIRTAIKFNAFVNTFLHFNFKFDNERRRARRDVNIQPNESILNLRKYFFSPSIKLKQQFRYNLIKKR